MDNSGKIIGIASLVSIGSLIGISELPKTIAGFNNSEWLLLLLGALSISTYLLSDLYKMSRQMASKSK